MKNEKTTNDSSKKMKKQEIIYSAIVEKELLHNGLVQREQLKTLKELNNTIKDLTEILKVFETHQFLEIHKHKWKIVLYNLSLGMLFAIGTVLGLLLLSWSTYHFFKDSTALKDVIDSQLKIRQFSVQDIKEKVKSELKKDPEINSTILGPNSNISDSK
ncbi:MAG: hypothetical protein PHZ26_02620 [Candidatus Gracilibacteria bacterium]|nr:hypothetical protein [Candidatus Gracilibacteria bacterium]MDD2908626.1 hypothetical protein [Candidatus Gracilibacteria bacterium]